MGQDKKLPEKVNYQQSYPNGISASENMIDMYCVGVSDYW